VRLGHSVTKVWGSPGDLVLHLVSL
jgi:hypothetical protein